jgi:hypothetical protein
MVIIIFKAFLVFIIHYTTSNFQNMYINIVLKIMLYKNNSICNMF